MRAKRISCTVSIAVFCIVALAIAPFTAYGADKLIVQDSSAHTQFDVTDSGTLILPTATGMLGIGTATPGDLIDVVGDNITTTLRLTKYGGNPGANFRAAGGTLASPTQVLANSLLGGFTAAGYTNAGAFGGNTVGIYFYATDNFTAADQGTYLEIRTTAAGTTANSPKVIFNDGGMTLYGVVTTLSSRKFKDNISELPADKAIDALRNLEPVTFNYKFDKTQQHVGFIAEDVPSLVATTDRRGISEMDIVGVLTKVVKEQDKTIESLSEKLSKLEAKLNRLESKDISALK